MSLNCADPHCKDPGHSSERDNYVLDILCSVVESSHTVIPIGRRRKPGKAGHVSGCVPGWDKEVQPFKEEARLFHSLWLSAGRPNRGDLYTAMRKSRNLYHYAVRRTKRLRDLHRAKKLCEASLVDDMELIKEMRKVKKGCDVVTELPDIVGGVEGEENIVEYQPSGEGGARSPPATPHRLQNPKWPPGGPKMADGVWKGVYP